MNNQSNTEQTMPVMPKILVGSDDFGKLLLESDIFVDKTMLVKAFVENSSETVLITRPRRWGKSMNLDMIAKFLSLEVDEQGNRLPLEQRKYSKLFLGGEIDLGFEADEKKIIKPAKIADYPEIIKKYQGQYPVIKIGFKEVKGNSYEEIEDGIKYEVEQMFNQHKYLMNSNILNDADKETFLKYIKGNLDLILVKSSLKFLSDLLKKHFGTEVYILIDEYDTPINDAYIQFYKNKKDEFDKVIRLFQGLFGAALKTNTSLKKGLVTGILRVAKANIFSGLNNLGEDCLLDKKFAQYYGFTENEVEELLIKANLADKSAEIKKWYNGYHMGSETIYNPWSIMQCLSHEGVCSTYWVDSGGTGLLDKVLLSDKVQGELQLLLEDKSLVKRVVKHIAFDEFETNADVFYSLLLFAGYLNAKPESDDEEEHTQTQKFFLTIPNLELKNIYTDRVITWITRKFGISGSDYYSFVDLLTDKKIDQFMQDLAKYLLNSMSFHDLTSERDYHNLMGGILSPLLYRFIVKSNREAGLGRFDHILIPRTEKYNTAFIFEYKLSKNKKSMEADAKAALAQINDNHYDASLKDHPFVQSVIKIGMAFHGKEFQTEIES